MSGDNKEFLEEKEVVLSQQEIDNIVTPENFVGCGVDMMTFRMGENVLQIPFYNILGKSKTLDILQNLSSVENMDEDDQMRLTAMLSVIGGLDGQEYIYKTDSTRSGLKGRASRQNLFYRETKQDKLEFTDRGQQYYITSTPKRLVSLNEPGNTFGVAMRFLDGDHPNPREHVELVSAMRRLQPDWHTNNAFIQEKDEMGNIEVVVVDF